MMMHMLQPGRKFASLSCDFLSGADYGRLRDIFNKSLQEDSSSLSVSPQSISFLHAHETDLIPDPRFADVQRAAHTHCRRMSSTHTLTCGSLQTDLSVLSGGAAYRWQHSQPLRGEKARKWQSVAGTEIHDAHTATIHPEGGARTGSGQSTDLEPSTKTHNCFQKAKCFPADGFSLQEEVKGALSTPPVLQSTPPPHITSFS